LKAFVITPAKSNPSQPPLFRGGVVSAFSSTPGKNIATLILIIGSAKATTASMKPRCEIAPRSIRGRSNLNQWKIRSNSSPEKGWLGYWAGFLRLNSGSNPLLKGGLGGNSQGLPLVPGSNSSPEKGRLGGVKVLRADFLIGNIFVCP
jgi:hypothetical protein